MAKDDKKIVSLAGAREKDKEKNTEKLEKETKQDVVNCSFCGRPNFQVIKMIKGPGVNICSECIMICVQYLILEDKIPAAEAQKILDAFWRESKK